MENNSASVVEEISKFLEGHNDQKYITGIEADYSNNLVHLMIDDPEKGKYMEKQTYQPFMFIRDFRKAKKAMFGGDKQRIKSAMELHGITIKELRTDNKQRLEDGYKYLVTTSKQAYNLYQFFKASGYDVFNDQYRLFSANKNSEQFLINTGKRLFKGFDSYNDIHKFYFDIETTSLLASDGNIFLIGMKDNRGFRKVLQIDLDDPIESERQMILDFFDTIVSLKPAVVAGYNSEFFDFTFILERAKILGINFGSRTDDGIWDYDTMSSLNSKKPIRRQRATIKFGNTTENYEQTIMWGINVIDISHAVRKAQAINSDIKSWGLKYICKYDELAAPNRMYVKDGGKIYQIWQENKWYTINKTNNEYKLIPDSHQDNPKGYVKKISSWVDNPVNDETHPSIVRLKEFFGADSNNINIIRGADIIFQYLLDDLTETEMVDNKYNQSSFMLGKITPAPYVRTSTMGNASLWKLLMQTWSYEQRIAIPINERKRDFVGGLSRLLRCGYAKNVLKMDFKALYPSIQLTYDIFPSFDITGVLKKMLTYFREARIGFQLLKKKYEEEGNTEMAALMDTKQLPIKILANSNFGALSAPEIFPWADVNLGEQITCTGRQYLRWMVDHFKSYGFMPLVLDTDGCNFSIPDNADEIFYTDKEGNKHQGYAAVLAEFNDGLHGFMKLEEDGIYESTINFARKNYCNLIYDKKKNKYKVKLVGASIKSKTIQTYIAEFLDKGLDLLLDGKGKEFIDEYNKYIKKIYNKEIPLIKIANKAKVNSRVATYQNDMKTKVQKNGRPPARQAHMELLIEHNLNPSLGEVIYYVNNGKVKSHGDLNNSYLLDMAELETKPDTIGEYNVPRAIESFNNRLHPILVCFDDEVRERLFITNPKDIAFFTDKQMELISGKPLPPEKKDKKPAQDAITIDEYDPIKHENEPLMEMSENEIIFWNKVRKDPKEIFEGFTTELSEVKLLDLNDPYYEQEFNAIVDSFGKQDVVIKHSLDYLVDDDLYILKDKDGWKLMKYEFGEHIEVRRLEPELISSMMN